MKGIWTKVRKLWPEDVHYQLAVPVAGENCPQCGVGLSENRVSVFVFCPACLVQYERTYSA